MSLPKGTYRFTERMRVTVIERASGRSDVWTWFTAREGDEFAYLGLYVRMPGSDSVPEHHIRMVKSGREGFIGQALLPGHPKIEPTGSA